MFIIDSFGFIVLFVFMFVLCKYFSLYKRYIDLQQREVKIQLEKFNFIRLFYFKWYLVLSQLSYMVYYIINLLLNY